MAGIRSTPGLDLAIVATQREPGSAAAVFTRNRFVAAPVLVARESLAATRGRARGAVINAGCANAGTGPGGLDDARRVAAAAAARLGCDPAEVVPASTGLIGSRLPVEAMVSALAGVQLDATPQAGTDAARAIMTTDTRPKQRAALVELGDGRSVRVGGMAKGAGMIHPDMATMLAVITTDAPAAASFLSGLLRDAADATFNQVTVDGDTSTNDMVLLIASGGAGGDPIEPAGPEAGALAAAIGLVCRGLAVDIAADGEGAEHVIEVVVAGATDDASARRIARTVAGSSLVKTAVHGADPNWGRLAAAAGRSGEAIEMDRLCVQIGELTVYRGAPCSFDPELARRALRGATVTLRLDIGLGEGRGEAWGCDLSHEYVTINAEYTT
jgi:glutamate N-acetyltransferase / amino-acid N-acetyltransferase